MLGYVSPAVSELYPKSITVKDYLFREHLKLKRSQKQTLRKMKNNDKYRKKEGIG